jgi:hypothetical protein
MPTTLLSGSRVAPESGDTTRNYSRAHEHIVETVPSARTVRKWSTFVNWPVSVKRGDSSGAFVPRKRQREREFLRIALHIQNHLVFVQRLPGAGTRSSAPGNPHRLCGEFFS